jgi:hypothetical protein
VVSTEGRGGSGRRVDEGERPATVGAEVGEDACLADEGRAEDVTSQQLAGGSGTDEGDAVGACDNLEYEICWQLPHNRSLRRCTCSSSAFA